MFAYRNDNRKKTAGAALAAVLLVAGATACESGQKDGTGKAAASQGSAKGAVEVTPAAYLEKVKAKSEEITSLRYSMTGTAQGEQFSGDVSMRLKPSVAMSMNMATSGEGGQKAEIRLLDQVMFIGSEGKWIKFDTKSLDPVMAEQLNSAGGTASKTGENPGDRAGELLRAKDLKLVGEETIDGVKTKHLSGTVTLDELRAALASATPEAKKRQEQSVTALEAQGVKSLALDMWIDASDHTKQVRTRADAAKGPMDTTIKFLDYNQPVEVAAPPADQVVDLAEMMKGSGGS
ncbi:LppX_LprAFG lipoprotein [Streptomyces sp. NBC_01264]|uniref:LppX_LprAFG lipoprotein n=1 Tax=Streptomyces sp. NBC_01264 TaxID=2903804 RepID=UPI002253001E|nr:LppX_LprAFG lipoprotein [Streptomyces sp. NBC_01264]MCX4780416.1 LppX_LprAFG lipoprotein [Streptomyces sp. NBC_01264]